MVPTNLVHIVVGPVTGKWERIIKQISEKMISPTSQQVSQSTKTKMTALAWSTDSKSRCSVVHWTIDKSRHRPKKFVLSLGPIEQSVLRIFEQQMVRIWSPTLPGLEVHAGDSVHILHGRNNVPFSCVGIDWIFWSRAFLAEAFLCYPEKTPHSDNVWGTPFACFVNGFVFVLENRLFLCFMCFCIMDPTTLL